jgi:membrane-bound PQQ-dependent dehydrogenase (glucose/quinate/shikimate family)
MGSGAIARWAFAAFYLIVGIIALWGGIAAINPPPPEPSAFNPNPAAPPVNPAMVMTAVFYVLTAAAFLAAGAYAVMRTLKKDPMGLVAGLNAAFAAALAAIGIYLVWMGATLIGLGGNWYYLLAGLATIATAALIFLRNPLAPLVYAGVLAVTVVWSLFEAGLDFIQLLPRLAAWTVVGLWFLSPWYKSGMRKTAELPPPRGGRWVGFAALASVLVLAVAGMQGYSVVEGTKNEVAANAPAVTDWRNYGGVSEGQRFAQLTQINTENVGKLKEAWRFRTGVAWDFKQTPQMANGLVYICTAGNTLIALDGDTGEQKWRYDTKSKVPGGLENGSTFARTCRGLGYHEAPATYTGECAKRIITGTTDARLLAVDALTGEPCKSFGFDGVVSLVSGLGRSPPGNYMVTSTPLIAGDKIVVGGWVTDNQQLGNPSGVIRAFDAITGKFAWAWDMGNPGFHGLPDEGGEFTRGTPNSWTNASYDPQLNLIYAATGNSSPDYFAGELRSPEAEQNSSSVVAIDAATGERRWVYQTVHHDIWDWDVPSQPVLVSVRKDGQGDLIPAVAAPTKRGEIFLLDRRTGVPIYDIPEQPVPQNPAEGEKVSATQPFSPLPNFRADRNENNMWGLTPLDQLWCRVEFKKMRYEGHFTPPMRGGGGPGESKSSWGGTFQYPGNAGGFNWGSVSVDADNGLLVAAPMLMGNRIVLRSLEDRAAQAAEQRARREAARGAQPAAQAGQGGVPAPGNPEEQTRRPQAGGGQGGPGGPGGGGGRDPRFDQNKVLYTGGTTPFMSDWKLPLPFLNVGTEVPCFAPPYGQIGVIDLNTKKLLWKHAIGTMKISGPFGLATGLPLTVGTPVQGASMTTRAGLVFHGGAMDDTIRAFDLRTGKEKWEAPLPGSAHATPMSYMSAKGKQFVVITVPNPSWRYPRSSDMKPTDDQGGWVIGYALPDGVK